MKLDCSLVEDLYPLYVKKELKQENREAIEEHLRSCLFIERVFHKGL
jgi:predicted anti-sigma-YlaC factor YlaD